MLLFQGDAEIPLIEQFTGVGIKVSDWWLNKFLKIFNIYFEKPIHFFYLNT